jgi:hypothetical protein
MRAFFLLLICTFSLAIASSPITVKVDGKEVKFPNGQPTTLAGRTMVPLRGVFEAIGAYVEWNSELKTVTARKQDSEVILRIGDKVAKKNGAEIQIDAPPRIISGSTMVPLRFIAESLGAKVDYDKANNIVDISTSE